MPVTEMTNMDIENAGCIFSTMTLHPWRSLLLRIHAPAAYSTTHVHNRFGLLGSGFLLCSTSCIHAVVSSRGIAFMDVGAYDLSGTEIMTLHPWR